MVRFAALQEGLYFEREEERRTCALDGPHLLAFYIDFPLQFSP
jgi:hypothetical protein